MMSGPDQVREAYRAFRKEYDKYDHPTKATRIPSFAINLVQENWNNYSRLRRQHGDHR